LILNNNCIILENISKEFKLIPSRRTVRTGLSKNIVKKLNNNERHVLLEKISFQVKKGEFFGILGQPSSGKSTLLRIISRIYQPDSGVLSTNGSIIPILIKRISQFSELNASETIPLISMLYGASQSTTKKKIDDILKFADLEDFGKTKLKNFTTEMRLALFFSTAFELNPDILIIDELMPDIIPGFKDKCYRKFQTMKEAGKTIVYVSKNIPFLTRFCDRVLVLDEGKIVTIGKPEIAIQKYHELLSIQKMINE